jgi:hypothetical protein
MLINKLGIDDYGLQIEDFKLVGNLSLPEFICCKPPFPERTQTENLGTGGLRIVHEVKD